MHQPSAVGLGTRLRQLIAHLDRAVDEAYAEIGLTYRAAFTPVTRALLAADSMSVREIAAAAGATHSAASQTVAQMRRAGLVEDAPGPDGRERRVRLSDLARLQLPVVEEQWARTDAAAAALSREIGVDLGAAAARALDVLRERPFLGPGPDRPPVRWMDPAEQAAVLAGLADLVERHFVFADAAAAHAAEIRRWPVSEPGVSSEAFAQGLTQALRRRDGHFKVARDEPEAGPAAEKASGPSMSLRREGRTGVLDVALLADGDDPADAAEARDRLAGLAACDAAVIDLRGVPGGWPSMVELLAGPFLGPEPRPLVTFVSRDRPDMHSASRPDARLARLASTPLWLVVDGRTASAAESFAYALQSIGRATVVGSPTAGAANPGRWFPGPDGFRMFIATGAPIDPRTGTNWEGVGVLPDVRTEGDALGAALRLAEAGG
ncbi:S41 family peptidase [Glycomyces sp. A-F 0318]|uniref:S41 family peptidase n=1 Tax=Glycomyces amatae TaxID=2881355 RepID=UPI001E342E6F|nr:S41 family peptidase [Glycomyces amatae]MCD0445448.1 S41 family peptidase [Glycomyces amatae]